MRDMIVSPSLLSADFGNLKEEVKSVEDGGADWLHCDVMDGHFVPNITIGPFIVGAIKAVASRPLDVHIMIDRPAQYAEAFCKAGADLLTFHIEAKDDPLQVIEIIRAQGVKPGIAVSPDTPVSALEPVLDKVDMVLIMTVHPGFGGQSFMENCLSKVRTLRDKMGDSIHIQVDGGVNMDTVKLAAEAGADAFVAGTAVFKAENRAERIAQLRERAQQNFYAGQASA